MSPYHRWPLVARIAAWVALIRFSLPVAAQLLQWAAGATLIAVFFVAVLNAGIGSHRSSYQSAPVQYSTPTPVSTPNQDYQYVRTDRPVPRAELVRLPTPIPVKRAKLVNR